MNTNFEISLDLSGFFHNSRREQLLEDYAKCLQNLKWGWNGWSGEFFSALSPEQKQKISKRILKALDLRNEIKADRKKRMADAGVFEMMNVIENTF